MATQTTRRGPHLPIPDRAPDPRTTSPQRWFCLFLLISHLYYFHRWVFGYNDSGTSPTYSNTPQVWQVGKYLLVALISVAVVTALLRGRHRWQPTHGFGPALAVLVVLYFCSTLLAFGSGSVDVTTGAIKAWFFLPLVLLLPFDHRGPRTVRALYRVGAVLVGYHVVFSAVQLVAYLTTGRLPGLAYPGGLVRFGGGLDDPNGFGIWLILPILVSLTSWPGRHRGRVVLVPVLVALLGLTLSYSAIIALVVGMLAFIVIGREYARSIPTSAAVLVAGSWAATSPAFADIVRYKSISAASRLISTRGATEVDSVSYYFAHAGPLELLLGEPRLDASTEITYLNLAINQGIPLLLLLLAIVVATVCRGVQIVRRLRRDRRPAEAQLFAALVAYEIAFAVGSLGVPYFNVFPVNVTFWVVAMIIWLVPPMAVRAGPVRSWSTPRRRPASGYRPH